MTQLCIIGLISFILVFLFHRFVIENLKKRKIWSDALEKALVAVFTIFAVFTVDAVLKSLIEPGIEVKTDRQKEAITIDMRTSDSFLGLKSSGVEKIYFEYPVLGVIMDIDDPNPITEAKTAAFVIGGKDRNTLTNHLQLEISDISPSFKLRYRVLYKPARTGKYKMELLGFDRYAIRITWNYKGEEISKKEWRSIDTDEVTSAPIGRIWGGLVSDKPIKSPPKTVPKRPLK